MTPSLDEIQQVLNKATGYVLEVSRGISQWGSTNKADDEANNRGGLLTNSY